MTSRRPSKRELERALDDLDGGAGDAVTWGGLREWLWLDVRADGDGPTAEGFFGRPLTDDERTSPRRCTPRSSGPLRRSTATEIPAAAPPMTTRTGAGATGPSQWSGTDSTRPAR